MAVKEVKWIAPEWPPEESGTYSADLTIHGEFLKSIPCCVKQTEGGSASLTYDAVHIDISSCLRAADALDETMIRSALGPCSKTDTQGQFELWVQKGKASSFSPGNSVKIVTKGASQIVRNITKIVKTTKADPLASMKAKQAKLAADMSSNDGADEGEWDD